MMISLKIAFLFVLATTVADTTTATDAASGTASTSVSGRSVRKLQRRPDSERQLGPLPARRKLTEEDIFTRAFTVITSSKDITFVDPGNVQGKLTLQGSYFITYGGVYRSSSVELVPTNVGTDFKLDTQVLQPKTIPAIDEDFTFGGKCTTTNGKTITGIIAHSCFYDLCLGSPTDCVNIYAGTRFNFQPIQKADFRSVAVNVNNNGILSPQKGTESPTVSTVPSTSPSVVPSGAPSSSPSAPPSSNPSVSPSEVASDAPTATPPTTGRLLQNQDILGEVDTDDLRLDLDELPFGRAALPPTFPGFGFGGTGRYNGIKCTFDLITVAQRSFFPKVLNTDSPTSSPTLTDEPTVSQNRVRDLSEEEVDTEQVERELQRIDEDENDDVGVIVQKIFFTCNQRLPLGPKAI